MLPSDRATDGVDPAVASRPVLLVTPWYQGEGGVAVSSASLAASLRAVGVPVVVLHLGTSLIPRLETDAAGEQTVAVELMPRSVVTRRLRSLAGYWVRRMALTWALRRVVAAHDLRLVHFQYCVESYDEILAAVERYGLPVVTTFRGSEINVHFDDPEIAQVIRRLIGASTRVTAVSKALQRALAQRSPDGAAKSEVIRNAVPLSVWYGATTPPTSKPGPLSVDVLFAGNLLPVKGPDQLLDAFRIIHARRPESTLAFVGSGPMEAALRAAVANAGLGHAVQFRGRIERSSMMAHFAHARILALPSRNEGMPLAAMEAHLAGLPVVAMDVGGVSEVVQDGETGRIVPAGDVEAFAEAALELLRDEPRRAQFGDAARSLALADFNPIEMARQYAALYDRVAPVTPATSKSAASASPASTPARAARA